MGQAPERAVAPGRARYKSRQCDFDQGTLSTRVVDLAWDQGGMGRARAMFPGYHNSVGASSGGRPDS